MRISKHTGRVCRQRLLGLALLAVPVPLAAQDQASPLPVELAEAASTRITVKSPFGGDVNGNSHSLYSYGTSSSGPWTAACGPAIGGRSDWRYCSISNLAPGTDYFVRVEFVDPDGIAGTNPQVLGPVRTEATGTNAVEGMPMAVTVQDTHLLASLPVLGDENGTSEARMEVATSEGGPWTEKCGPFLSLNPKLCRIHGLESGVRYWIRATVTDADGVSGSASQVVGPVTYSGLQNAALGRSISADPGWGCCSSSSQLVDGRIMYPDWPFGFAWTGGTAGWAGGAPGWKQATIDLGSPQTVGRVDWWTHDAGNVPSTWKVEVSDDGTAFVEVFSTSEPRCRTAGTPFRLNWSFPSCGHSAVFAPRTARHVRYSFDDRTLFDGIHGWAVELEVFGAGAPPPSGTSLVVGAPLPAEVYPGDAFQIDLELLSVLDLYAAQAECRVVATVATPHDATFGALFDPIHRLVAANRVDAAAGTWLGAISQQRPARPLTGSGRLASVTFDAVAPGTSAITCVPLLADRNGVPLGATATAAEVTVLRFASVQGSARYQGRSGHGDVQVSATGPVVGATATDPSGQFVIDRLKASTYELRAVAPGYLPACKGVTVQPGESAAVGQATILGGDANGDGVIDIGDATLLGANFGQGVPPADSRADINADGIVNVQDLAVLAGNYGLEGCQAWS